MTIDPEALDRSFELYRTLIEEDAALADEFRSSASEFFGRDAAPGSPDVEAHDEDARMAGRRYLEWFLVERPSIALRNTPVDALEATWVERAEPSEQILGHAFKHSLASVFEVTGIDRGTGVWLRDLAGFGEYPVSEPRASELLEEGDLIVGRLFPLEDSVYVVSRAAGFFRNAHLADAVRDDLQRAREGRRGVLRIAQKDLEAMFWSGQGVTAAARTPVADPVGEARRALVEGGVAMEEVDEILATLGSAPYSADHLLLGGGDVLGTILDRLAFETSIDLGQARAKLVQAWIALSSDESVPASAASNGVATESPRGPAEPSETLDVDGALAAFERGRAQGEDLDSLFSALEQNLDLPAGSSIDDDVAPAPDFPGVVPAMLTEFVWETEREHGAAAARALVILDSFGRFAEGAELGVFENIGARELLLFTCWWLLEENELDNADQARELLAALGRFCRWAEDRHGVPLQSDFKEHLNALQSSLPRVVEANRRRTRKADPSRGELFEVLEEGNSVRLVDRAGDVHEAQLDPLLARWVRVGDRVRAARHADGRLAVYGCYPPELGAIEALESAAEADDDADGSSAA